MSTQPLTAIVTGASTGLGKAITKIFLDDGINVVMNSVNEGRLRATYEDLGAPANAITVAGDVADRDTGARLVAAAVEKFGGIDIVVNNAGIFSAKPFLDVEEADLDRFFAVNFKGTYFTTQAAIPELRRRGGGSVINIGTVLVDHAIGGFPASAGVASKAALHSLTIQLAAEFGKDNIRFNTVAPGVIRTPMHARNGIEDIDSLAGLHLLDRVGESDDIARAVHMLATSNFITGDILKVDGGHAAGHHIG